MTITELLNKPVWQMTGEELLFLAQHGNIFSSRETIKNSAKEEKRYVYGLSGIARLFVSPQTLRRYCSHFGKKVILLAVFFASKEKNTKVTAPIISFFVYICTQIDI